MFRGEKRSSCFENFPSRNLIFSTAVITLGSAFQHGYYTAILNAPHKELKAWTASFLKLRGWTEVADTDLLVNSIWASGTSIFFFGGIFGSIIAGATIDKFDRRRVTLVNCSMIIFPLILMLLDFFLGLTLLLALARFLLGLIAGVFSCSVPIYLAEISPLELRGMVCTWYNVMYSIGVGAAFGIGHPQFLGDDPWIIMMLIPAIPLIIQMVLMIWIPVSPRFLLIKKGKYEEAMKVLKWLRRTELLEPLEREMEEISSELEDYFLYRAVRDVKWIQLYKLKYMRKPLLISIMIMCAQQLCGINVFLLYSSAIFEQAGLPNFYGHLSTVTIGAILIIMSLVSMCLIEIAGRRMLLLYGYVGTFIFSLVHYLTYMYNEERLECVGAVAAVFIWFLAAHYALGPNSIPWFIVPEMFNQASRPKAMAIAACCNWTMNCLVALTFWPLTHIAKANVILIYLFSQVIFFFLMLKYVPETMHKSITEINSKYQ